MDVDSLAASLQIWHCPSKQNSQGHTAFTIGKNSCYSSDSIQVIELPNQTPYEHIYS